MPVDGDIVKAKSQPSIYLIEKALRHWIPDSATVQAHGGWGSVRTLPDDQVWAIPEGDPVPSVVSGATWPDGAFIGSPAGTVYIIEHGQKRGIPNAATFNAHQWDWHAVEQVPDWVVAAIPDGPIIPPTSILLADGGAQQIESGHFMQSRFELDLDTGALTGLQHIWTHNWFGFHASAFLFVLDGNGVPLPGGVSQEYRTWCDGAPIGGSPDRIEPMPRKGQPVEHLSFDRQAAVSVQLLQALTPNSIQHDVDQLVKTGKQIAQIGAAVQGILTAFGL